MLTRSIVDYTAPVSDRMARNLRLPVGMVRIEVKGRWVNSFLGKSGLSMIYQLLEMFSASMTACCTVQGVIVTRNGSSTW